MQMLSITVPIERLVRAAAVGWYGYVLRKEESNILKEALNFELREKERPKDYLEKTS